MWLKIFEKEKKKTFLIDYTEAIIFCVEMFL